MATNTLIKLPTFSYTSLDFDTIINDVKTLIEEHPEYDSSWDDFLESNAGRMFVETMAFIMEKLANRVDWIAQEMFVSTATQRQSLINILKLINHRPSLPTAAKVNVTATLTKWTSTSFKIPLREQIIGLNTDGSTTKFECIDMADDGKPDYSYQYVVEPGTESNKIYTFANVPFYQGQTYTDDSIFMDGIDNEEVTLEQYPVIENSVRVWDYNTNNEFIEVDSFVSPEAQQSDLTSAEKVPAYIVDIDADNKATIKFGASSIVTVPTRGERIKILYRVGGGENTNIVAGAINTTKSYSLDNNTKLSVIYTNPSAGFGGADEEDVEEAALTAPLSLRSANKTVTQQDYVDHLEDYALVMHSMVYGKQNEPDEIYTEYGYYMPPLETWIYVCPNRDNYNSIDPLYFNKQMKLGKPYSLHKIFASETISFTSAIQKVYLTKYREYIGFPLYIIAVDNYTGTPYYEDVDYTYDKITGSISRIATSDNGTIPAGNITLRVCYISDDTTAAFKTNCVKTFSADNKIYLDSTLNSIYPSESIVVMKSDGTIYTEDTDYTINYANSYIQRTTTGAISTDETVFIQYANNWVSNDSASEESLILSSIKNKKMICIDNVMKDARYRTFDVVATVYCYKNLRTNVENNLKSTIQALYSIDKQNFAEQVSKSKLISQLMSVSGVRYVDISYLGTNYEVYRRYLLGDTTLDVVNSMDANKVENYISAKYNEILVLNNDNYEGSSSLTENQRTGLIFTYKDAS